jgi:hypothetical protein
VDRSTPDDTSSLWNLSGEIAAVVARVSPTVRQVRTLRRDRLGTGFGRVVTPRILRRARHMRFSVQPEEVPGTAPPR